MRTAAILPVKRFTRAKQRLGESVADSLRHRLAAAMVDDVLLALSQTEAIELTIVVTREPSMAAAARVFGASVLGDEAEAGQSAAAGLGIAAAAAMGFERVLCVPGDCPALDPAELEALLDADAGQSTSERRVTILPDRHGTGTNGLLLCPPGAIEPSFGPGSCERHSELALTAGAASRVERVSSLLLDVDTGADLEALRARLGEEGARSPRTRAVLGRVRPTEALSGTSAA